MTWRRSRPATILLDGNPLCREFFTAFSSPDELAPDQRSLIFRPRTSDVLTAYPTLDGPRHLRTTFSPDHADLHYQNPEVTMRVLEIPLLDGRRVAHLIRWDAVIFLSARPGTSCVHLPETHEEARLFRDAQRAVAPHVALVAETKVPHSEKVAYLGDDDEAHLVTTSPCRRWSSTPATPATPQPLPRGPRTWRRRPRPRPS